MQTLEVELLPKQMEFLESTAKECLYSGAYGAGKTYALCYKTLVRASYPNTRELLCRKFHSSMAQSTLRTLFQILPENMYQYSRSAEVVTITGGGEIIIMGLDSQKIGSIECTGANVDEALELSEDEYNALLGRIRLDTPAGRQLNLACNPGGPLHHLARRFGISGDPAPDTQIITTNSFENTYLPTDYLSSLDSLRGVSRSRLVLGQWVAAEGKVYPGLQDNVIPDISIPPTGQYYGGIDFGWKDRFAAILGVVYKSTHGNILYVYGEHTASETPIEIHCNMIKKLPMARRAMWFAPPDDPENIRELIKNDLSTSKAENNILFGVDAVNGLLSSDHLFISNKCSMLITEDANYVYDKRTDAPADGNDHCLDALRYLIASLKKRGVVG